MNQPPLLRTPNGDDAPADIGMGLALSVLLAICLIATGAAFALEHIRTSVNEQRDTHALTSDHLAGASIRHGRPGEERPATRGSD